MNETTLKAWNESCEHWERLATGTSAIGEGISASDCAFCKKFFRKSGRFANCVSCPIRNRTGFSGCLKTPWEQVYDFVEEKFAEGLEAGDGLSMEQIKQLDEFKRLASIQLAFLKSLRPE